jgi:hypothetical protein
MPSGEASPCRLRGIVRGELILADDPFRHVKGYLTNECFVARLGHTMARQRAAGRPLVAPCTHGREGAPELGVEHRRAGDPRDCRNGRRGASLGPRLSTLRPTVRARSLARGARRWVMRQVRSSRELSRRSRKRRRSSALWLTRSTTAIRVNRSVGVSLQVSASVCDGRCPHM